MLPDNPESLAEDVLGLPNEPEPEYVARCPACGDPIDYCQGHGDIGDPIGSRVLASHDDGDHRGCHPVGCVEAKVWSRPVRPAAVTAEQAMRYLADKALDEIDRRPVHRFGPPWRRQNYVRRLDGYEAVYAALRDALKVVGRA